MSKRTLCILALTLSPLGLVLASNPSGCYTNNCYGPSSVIANGPSFQSVRSIADRGHSQAESPKAVRARLEKLYGR